MHGPLFSPGQQVRGFPLLDFLEWASASDQAIRSSDCTSSSHPFGLLALPPVQRSAVWRPKQVIALWDSLLRGLPIGGFLLVPVEGEAERYARPVGGDGITSSRHEAGFDLLDGQQRTRAMLLGLLGPGFDRRCLWVDLAEGRRGRLRLTSASQPFGYDAATGEKLSRRDRIIARKDFDKGLLQPLRIRAGLDVDRELYDHEIFGYLKKNSAEDLLPRPGKSSAATFRLDHLLKKWRANGLVGLTDYSGRMSIEQAVITNLAVAFGRLEKAEVALTIVDPSQFESEQDAGVQSSLLTLFDRIGTGGTPLSADERLFSILKHHQPQIHNAVTEIYESVGRVQSPTQIAISALRLANAIATDNTRTPEVSEFTRVMSGHAKDGDAFRRTLAALIPAGNGKGALDTAQALMTRTFAAVRRLIEFNSKTNPNGLPRVALVDMPTELWQVLLFWAVRRLREDAADDLSASRDDLIRFALFWRLCVYNEAKAGQRAFRILKSAQAAPFPGVQLYKDFVQDSRWERCAEQMLSATQLRAQAEQMQPTSAWRSYEERFQRKDAPAGYEAFFRLWWRGGRKMLPWLQRAYITRVFPHYDPLSDRDDDRPYDVDHICPQEDWNGHWTAISRHIPEFYQASMYNGRWEIGNALGNLRLVASSTNRSDGRDTIEEKFPFMQRDHIITETDRLIMNDFCVAALHLDQWRDASGPTHHWSEERLCAFQQAVEGRTLWLYEKFYDALGFSAWLDGEP